MRTHAIAILVLAGSVAGCGTDPATRPASGTRRMADTLAYLYGVARSQAQRYEFLNRERADELQAGLDASSQQASRDRYDFARQLLLAGRTADAIARLRDLEASSGLKLARQRPETKQFYDLLGIAYLRLGEQENCNLNPNTSVCILGALHHEQQEGARQAIAVYERILQEFPADRGAQWLLNVAYMATGGYPGRVPKQFLIPGLTTKRDTTFPTFYNVARDVGAAINGLAGGLCVEDFNRDGLLDIFTSAWGLMDPVHLLIADGQGGFVDETNAAGLGGIVGGANCRHADYDNDGYEDVFLMRGGWLGDGGIFPNSLLHNRGDGTFEDVTFAAGVGSMHPTHTMGWADFNLDGYLDFFVGHESGVDMGWGSHPSELFVNNRDGTFTEVSKKVGLNVDAFVKGVTWGDVDNDGLPDLFLSVFGGRNRLYMNRGGTSLADWRFEEVAAKAGVQEPNFSFPTWFFDYDNDGWQDLLVLSYDNRGSLPAAVTREYLGLPAGASDYTRLYRNRHDGTFEDVTKSVGLADKAIYAMGSNFGDIDNDGWLDFYLGTGNPDLQSIIPNRMFRGVDGKRFQEVTLEGGFGHLQKGHGTAFADFDRDGDEDVFMMLGGAYAGDVFTSVLFENPGWPNRSWITLDLEGRGGSNRSAIGARVQVTAADANGATRTIERTIDAGGSFGSGSLQLHVGLGAAVHVPLVRVIWPDAKRSQTSYTTLEPKRTYLLVQGQDAKLLDRPPIHFRHGATAPDAHRHTGS